MLSKVASSTIFWVFGMTQLGIKLRSPRPLANTLTILPVSGIHIYIYIYIHIYEHIIYIYIYIYICTCFYIIIKSCSWHSVPWLTLTIHHYFLYYFSLTHACFWSVGWCFMAYQHVWIIQCQILFLYTGWNDKIVVLKKTTLQLYFKTFIENVNSGNLIM